MARLIRWKLPLHGVPTAGTTTLISAGGADEPLPGRSGGAPAPRDRPPRHRRHSLPRRRALRAASGAAPALVGDVQPERRAPRACAPRCRARGRVPFGGTAPVSGRLTVPGGRPAVAAAGDSPGAHRHPLAVGGRDHHGRERRVLDHQSRPRATAALRLRFAGQRRCCGRPPRAGSCAAVTSAGVGLPCDARVRQRRAGGALRGRVRPRKRLRVPGAPATQRGALPHRRVGMSPPARTRATAASADRFVPARAGTYRLYVRRGGRTATRRLRGARRSGTGPW